MYDISKGLLLYICICVQGRREIEWEAKFRIVRIVYSSIIYYEIHTHSQSQTDKPSLI